jgi:hypothetical protein
VSTDKSFVRMTLLGAIATAFWVTGPHAFAAESPTMLTGEREVPPVVTAATATSDIVVGTDMHVSGGVTTTGIEATAAHIHVGAPGVSGPVAVTLTKTQPGHWSVPDGTKLTAAQYDSFKAGNLYINVHSAEHAAGEIRAQLKP